MHAESVRIKTTVLVNQPTQDDVPNASMMRVLLQEQCLIRLSFHYRLAST